MNARELRFVWETERPLVMGVLNVTPDSFSDGGRFFDVDRAAAQAQALVAAGADIIDIGGESTRPGAEPVSADEELRRVVPVIERICGRDNTTPAGEGRLQTCPTLPGATEAGAVFPLRSDERGCAGITAGTAAGVESSRRAGPARPTGLKGNGPGEVLVSVDTAKAVVAEQALAAGACIVNDITALRGDVRMAEVVAAARAGVVLMHMQGTPQTMQQQPRYEDVVREVRDFLAGRIAFAVAQGIDKSRIAIDPGIGFGKTVEQNLQLLARLGELLPLGCPVLVGPSRKSFIGRVLGREASARLWGTAAAVAWAVAGGAGIVRVHDVAEMVDVVRMTAALHGATRPGATEPRR